ncbi:P22 phage major capsid protein family protein, partial [Pseudomonas aeruginosa]
PANNAAISVFGAGGTVSPQSMAFHKDAFTLVTADLELPDGVHFAGRAADKQTGLSIRIVRQYTINNDSIPTRMDVLYGWASLY